MSEIAIHENTQSDQDQRDHKKNGPEVSGEPLKRFPSYEEKYQPDYKAGQFDPEYVKKITSYIGEFKASHEMVATDLAALLVAVIPTIDRLRLMHDRNQNKQPLFTDQEKDDQKIKRVFQDANAAFKTFQDKYLDSKNQKTDPERDGALRAVYKDLQNLTYNCVIQSGWVDNIDRYAKTPNDHVDIKYRLQSARGSINRVDDYGLKIIANELRAQLDRLREAKSRSQQQN